MILLRLNSIKIIQASLVTRPINSLEDLFSCYLFAATLLILVSSYLDMAVYSYYLFATNFLITITLLF
jgi:hypothetical protein